MKILRSFLLMAGLSVLFFAAEATQPSPSPDHLDIKERGGVYLFLEKEAEQGNPVAQVQLALVYIVEGTPKDLPKAFTLLRKASEKGSPLGQVCLAAMYQDGKGTQKDLQKAFYWREKAAEQGYAGAHYPLAYMYEHGEGTQRDVEKALYWYDKAAQNGNMKAKQAADSLRARLNAN